MISALLSLALAGEVQRYALIVGANDGITGDEPLLFAAEDATRVAEVLEELGDIPAENILRLRNSDASRVRATLLDLQARIDRKKGQAETLFFFYYSGHGDAEGLHLQGTTLPFTDLIADLAALPVDVRILVVDACQSGELTRMKGARPAEPFEIQADDRLDTEGMAIITSSSIGEDAQESDRLQGGVFTHHFLTGLKGAADASGDHRITLTEAYQYGYNETVKSTSRARFVQRPGFGFALSGRNDLVLTRVGDPGRNAMIALDGGGQWLVMAGDGTGNLVNELSVERRSLLAMSPGPYLVRYRNERGIREASVDLTKGETLELGPGAMDVVSPGQTIRKGMETEHRAAMAWTVGLGALGPTSPGLGIGPSVSVGTLIDYEPMTVALRGILAYHQHENPQLQLRQVRVGADLAGIKKLDVRRFALGMGVRGGADLTRQFFQTIGEAPTRQALSGRLGPVISLDVPVGRHTLVLSGGTDVQLYNRYDADRGSEKLDTAVVPSLQLEFARYAR